MIVRMQTKIHLSIGYGLTMHSKKPLEGGVRVPPAPAPPAEWEVMANDLALAGNMAAIAGLTHCSRDSTFERRP
jgi:hypothetical protein